MPIGAVQEGLTGAGLTWQAIRCVDAMSRGAGGSSRYGLRAKGLGTTHAVRLNNDAGFGLEKRKRARKQIRLVDTLRANADNGSRLERCRNNDDPSADLFRIKARGTIHTPRRGASLDPKMDCAGDLQRLAIERLCAVNDGQQAG